MDQQVSNFSSLIPSANLTSDYFDGIFENRLSKIFFVTLTIIAIPVTSILNYSVIWYERFGQDAKRTIVNRMFSSLCWTGIEFSFLVSLPELFRFLCGPLPEWFCWFHLIIKNGIVSKLCSLQTGLIILRHACIFWLKNPAAFYDDFWSCFINIWVVIFSYTSSFVFIYLPGKQPINYYICTGKNPHDDLKQNTKFNIPFIILAGLALPIHIYSGFKIYRYKKKYNKKNLSGISIQNNIVHKTFEGQPVTDFTSIAVTLAVLVMFLYIFVRVARTDPQDLSIFPNYLFVYWINLANGPIVSLILIILTYIRNEKMRKIMYRELKDFLGL